VPDGVWAPVLGFRTSGQTAAGTAIGTKVTKLSSIAEQPNQVRSLFLSSCKQPLRPLGGDEAPWACATQPSNSCCLGGRRRTSILEVLRTPQPSDQSGTQRAGSRSGSHTGVVLFPACPEGSRVVSHALFTFIQQFVFRYCQRWNMNDAETEAELLQSLNVTSFSHRPTPGTAISVF